MTPRPTPTWLSGSSGPRSRIRSARTRSAVTSFSSGCPPTGGGRALVVRVLHATRVTLGLAVSAVAVAALLGSLIGLIAGYLGGRTDVVLMFCMDILLA